MSANCNFTTTVVTEPASTCVAEYSQNNRPPGTCTAPYSQTSDCITKSGNVAITFTAYAPIIYTNGSCDCNLQSVVWTTSGTVNCPVTSNSGGSCDVGS